VGERRLVLEQLGREGVGRLGQELDEARVQAVGVLLQEVVRRVRDLLRYGCHAAKFSFARKECADVGSFPAAGDARGRACLL